MILRRTNTRKATRRLPTRQQYFFVSCGVERVRLNALIAALHALSASLHKPETASFRADVVCGGLTDDSVPHKCAEGRVLPGSREAVCLCSVMWKGYTTLNRSHCRFARMISFVAQTGNGFFPRGCYYRQLDG